VPPAAYACRVDLVPHGRGDRAAGAGGLDDLVDDADLDGLVDTAQANTRVAPSERAFMAM
jgi:hypothetical protein